VWKYSIVKEDKVTRGRGRL